MQVVNLFIAKDIIHEFVHNHIFLAVTQFKSNKYEMLFETTLENKTGLQVYNKALNI